MSANTSSWPKGLNRWGFDPRKPLAPQVASAAAQMVFILGGPAVALFMIARYRPLIADQTLYVSGLSFIAIGFLASLAVPLNRKELSRLPATSRFLYRVSLGFAFTAWVFGLGGIANGFGTPIFVRDVPVVAKHETLERDPARRTHYVSARPWPGSRQVQDINAPLSVYDSLQVPTTTIHTSSAELQAMPHAAKLRLVLGKGRLGLDWLKTVELPDSRAQ